MDSSHAAQLQASVGYFYLDKIFSMLSSGKNFKSVPKSIHMESIFVSTRCEIYKYVVWFQAAYQTPNKHTERCLLVDRLLDAQRLVSNVVIDHITF